MNRKEDLLKKYCKGKTVLDVGCAGGPNPPIGFMHEKIASVAMSCIGIDADPIKIQQMANMCFDVHCANAEDFRVKNQSFDIVIATELIEHLNNVSDFLYCARRHMGKDTLLIISTPNLYAFNPIKQHILGYDKHRDNYLDNHSVVFTPSTMGEILRRHDLIIRELYYTCEATNLRGKIFSWLIPDIFHDSMLFIIKRKEANDV